MRSPADMEIIQIDITNACVHRCSNCTRFCGHHHKPFLMDFATFQQAVDSLDGFPGIVGVIGGEPTIHPEFEKFALYIQAKRLKTASTKTREPIDDILDHINKNLLIPLDSGAKSGLWSSLSPSYYKHFEVINDSFDYQALNDHDNTCMHQALLMARKDLGISDEEFLKLRDNCWIQNKWSATITPKGAFFCEVAGALDMLFNGPGGWKIEKDWWKRTPSEFGDQLQWCEYCSCCLDVPKRMASEGIDDISESMYEKLLAIGSPKVKKGKVKVHDLESFKKNKDSYKAFTGNTSYMDDNNSIRAKNSPNILPKEFISISEPDLDNVVRNNLVKDWVIVGKITEDTNHIMQKLKRTIINPGCLYTWGDMIIFNINAMSLRKISTILEKININILKSLYPDDKKIIITPDSIFIKIYKKLKRLLKRLPFLSVHLKKVKKCLSIIKNAIINQ